MAKKQKVLKKDTWPHCGCNPGRQALVGAVLSVIFFSFIFFMTFPTKKGALVASGIWGVMMIMGALFSPECEHYYKQYPEQSDGGWDGVE